MKYLKTTPTAHMYFFKCCQCKRGGFIWIKIGTNKFFPCPYKCGQAYVQIHEPPTEPRIISAGAA